jgi:ligand-binding sensor domain-containing protein
VSASKPNRVRSLNDFSMRLARAMALCALMALTPHLAVADDWRPRLSQYAHTAWRVRDGDLTASPVAIAQTADGFVWIGGQSGLVRFDGIRFVSWTPPAGSTLPSTSISALLGTPDGALWIGTENGLSRWRAGQLTTFPATRGRITAIGQTGNGTIWMSRSRTVNGGGPICEIAETVRCHDESEGLPCPHGASAMLDDARGGFWLGCDTALVHWTPSGTQVFPVAALATNQDLAGVRELAPGSDDGLWVGMAIGGPGLGLQRFIDGHWHPVSLPGLQGDRLEVQTIRRDSHDGLWIGTSRGLCRMQGNAVDHIGLTDGLSGDSIQGLYEDGEGKIWVSTTAGLDRLRPNRVLTFTSAEGLGTDEVDAVLATRDGTVWVGGQSALSSIRDGRVTTLTPGSGLPGQQVTSLFEDSSGQFWVGIDTTLTICAQGHFTEIKKRDGGRTGLIVDITEDPVDHDLWAISAGPPRALLRIRDRQVIEELPTNVVPAARSLAADPHGGLWLGLHQGTLARYRHGRLDPAISFEISPSRVDRVLMTPDETVFGATTFGLVACGTDNRGR